MKEIKESLQVNILNAIKQISDNINLSISDIIVEIPPKPELGDVAFPMFPYSKVLKKAPAAIAAQIVDNIQDKDNKYTVAGPYVNVFIARQQVIKKTLLKVINEKEKYGFGTERKHEKIMIEFSCPNTNKPLHLGHLRNDSIGESVSKILKANGADVCKVNLINDRGIHICKSMLAYKELGKGATPESENIKSDHFVGNYYVEYSKLARADADAEKRAQQMLVAWEDGDNETKDLWQKMNKWAIDGIEKTYEKTGVSFDKVYYESQTYSEGRKEVLKGLEKGIFYKDESNTIWVDLTDINLDKKVLLRGDGTSIYLTQDIGTAIKRHEDWPFDTLIYVVASEQQYHFKVLFNVIAKLGYKWAENLFHLSYGLVNLPEGRMKSREGTVIDADDLLKELTEMVAEEIKKREREEFVGDINATSEKVALGALNYFLLATTPTKDMIFNPAESLSFVGNTGPYLQYMGARIASILKKYGKSIDIENIDFDLLKEEDEWEIIKMINEFPETVIQAGKELNPSIITSFMYELSKKFSKYYHDNSVLNNESEKLVEARVTLCSAVVQALRNCMELTGIPYLEVM
ncbi:MAG: arginine--tRNA ligase [Spirochaetaceae bacterium]|nr:arginine--tRNA ligase [Spirochaetaceae bacterium]